jgi:hypothetical protein
MIYLCIVCELVGIDDESQRLVKDENCNKYGYSYDYRHGQFSILEYRRVALLT